MQVHIHQTHHPISDFRGIKKYLIEVMETENRDGLHVFSELFLTGYPLQDICLQRSFIDAYTDFLDEINTWSLGLKNDENMCLLIGGLQYTFSEEQDEVPKTIKNVILKLTPGSRLEPIYTKRLLPNYDIFDEKKYYTKGDIPGVFNFQEKNIALLICEDMWFSSVHSLNPVADLKKLNQNFDLVVNLSASPYNIYKNEKRIDRAINISRQLKAPFLYVNRVGTEDEIIFDGGSFMVSGSEILTVANKLCEDYKILDLPEYSENSSAPSITIENTWESLFSADLITDQKSDLPKLRELDDKHCQEIIDVLCFGVQEYAAKSGFKKFTIALSGGLDSALVLAILKISKKKNQELEAIYMPSEYSRDISFEASKAMCEKNGIPFHVLPIKGVHQYCRDLFREEMGTELTGLSDENIQSRLRGLLLFARSNQNDSLVINTSNKSELSVGYSTIYGDSVGAISLLGDIYKSEAYQIAKYINRNYDGLIPVDIITRPPSAELRESQVDTDSLPPYERLDAILEGILSYRLSGKQLVELGFNNEEVERVLNLYRKTEFKRGQFCPILKIKSKSFGFGYRVPINKNSDYYLRGF